MWDHMSSHMKHTEQGLGVYTRQPEVSISTPVSFRVDTSGPASLPGFPRKVSPFPAASYTSQPLPESRNREITLPCPSPCSTVPPLQFFHSCSDESQMGRAGQQECLGCRPTSPHRRASLHWLAPSSMRSLSSGKKLGSRQSDSASAQAVGLSLFKKKKRQEISNTC